MQLYYDIKNDEIEKLVGKKTYRNLARTLNRRGFRNRLGRRITVQWVFEYVNLHHGRQREMKPRQPKIPLEEIQVQEVLQAPVQIEMMPEVPKVSWRDDQRIQIKKVVKTVADMNELLKSNLSNEHIRMCNAAMASKVSQLLRIFSI